MKGAIAKAKELEQEIENAVILGQFVNTANPRAHEKQQGRRSGKIHKAGGSVCSRCRYRRNDHRNRCLFEISQSVH